MFLPFKIALKFHYSYKKNTLISLVSLVSIIGISIGIIITIVALSIINGFEYELDKRILSVIPHGRIISTTDSFTNWNTVINKIKYIPGIIYINPYINFSGIIEFNKKYHFIYIKSINLLENYTACKNNHILANFIEKKSWKYFCERSNQILVGQGVSNSLNLNIDDWITIIFVHNFTNTNQLIAPKKIQLQVSGVLNLQSQFDKNIAIIPLSDAKMYSSNQSKIDGIEIMVKNVFYIDQIIKKIKKKLHINFIIKSWMDIYGDIYTDIQTVRLIIYISVILIIGMSCFNVIATLILCIKNKYHDIAILRALGTSNIVIQHIFLWYGLIIYCISSLIGIVLGILSVLSLKKIDIKFIEIFGKNIFPKGVYFIDFIPIYLNKWDIFYILIINLLLGMLISWYVSFKAKFVHLNQILR